MLPSNARKALGDIDGSSRVLMGPHLCKLLADAAGGPGLVLQPLRHGWRTA